MRISVEAAAGAAWLKGRIVFRVLYRSDQENGKISCLKGEIPFQEKLNMDGGKQGVPLTMLRLLPPSPHQNEVLPFLLTLSQYPAGSPARCNRHLM